LVHHLAGFLYIPLLEAPPQEGHLPSAASEGVPTAQQVTVATIKSTSNAESKANRMKIRAGVAAQVAVMPD
jgi:hypothetical protein